MDFDLTDLLDWARRQISDGATPLSEVLTGTGGTVYTLNTDGDVSLVSVLVDEVPVAINTITLSGSQLTFGSAVTEGASIEVHYMRSQYSDDDLLTMIADASFHVGVDLDTNWVVDNEGSQITNIADSDFIKPNGSDTGVFDQMIQRLIILRVDQAAAQDKNSRATDDAILIKDGDTVIDTSKGSGAQSSNASRKKSIYEDARQRAQLRRFQGGSIRGGGCRWLVPKAT